jgi:hypothetical protein
MEQKMTAEIAVMNKSAVALAADSKVTISGSRSAKTYDTVNKVFTLSKVHPVGIMVFGNAEFMEYPWETIIKLYRKEKKLDSESHVIKWAEDFEKFLRKFGKIEDKHKIENVENVVSSWFHQIRETSEMAAFSRGVAIPSPEFTEILIERLNSKQAELGADQHFKGAKGKALLRGYISTVASIAVQAFGCSPDEDIFKAAVVFGLTAIAARELSPQSSGIVVAGFGEEEFFPSLVEYSTDGYVGPDIKILKSDVSEITREVDATIRAFAQGDMVERFMNGVDSTFMQALFNSFGRTLAANCFTVLEDYGLKKHQTDATRSAIMDGVNKSLEAFNEDIQKYLGRNFSNPVISMVALLPKDELAHLAESLVALTSLKRRVSSDAETVGGPVDVALISKGDGFVWVKRKHYFSKDINPEFFRNYMHDVMPGGQAHAE